MTRHILPGSIGHDGRIDPNPVIVELASDGAVMSWHTLDGIEPHSTTPLRALLRLPDLHIIRISELS